MSGTLYRLDFASGKSYIGVTRGRVSKRYNAHCSDANRNSDCAVHRAWRKYGPPRLVVLAIVENYMLEATEKRAIREYKTMECGYNQTPGGFISPMNIPTLKDRVIRAMRGKKKPGNAGLLNAMHRPEVKAKMSAIMSGRVFSDEHRRKLSESAKKRDHSYLLGNTYGSVLKGIKRKSFSDEWKANMSKSKTPESCAIGWETRRKNKIC